MMAVIFGICGIIPITVSAVSVDAWGNFGALTKTLTGSNTKPASGLTPESTLSVTPKPMPTNPIKEVIVPPPTADVESGTVPYGTKVTFTPVAGHLAYSINGGKFKYEYFAAAITITEDTTVTVK